MYFVYKILHNKKAKLMTAHNSPIKAQEAVNKAKRNGVKAVVSMSRKPNTPVIRTLEGDEYETV